jgi:hypothetical protein
MRWVKDKRGQVRVIEAFFASVLLLSSLSIIPIVYRGSEGDVVSALSSTALNVLVSLDSNGHLAELVDSGNWSALGRSFEACLPAAVWFNLTVLDQSMNRLNSLPICRGGSVSDRIAVADYVCSSLSGNYAVYVLRLQLAAVD